MREDEDHGRDRAGGPESVPDWVRDVRARYNPPPPVPREAMWSAIHGAMKGKAEGEGVVDLGAQRRLERGRRVTRSAMSRRWAWATAAAAVLAVGIGIGRWSAPTGDPRGESLAVETTEARGESGVDLAARLHFGRTESLLTTVRSDARSGRVDASVGPWAQGLLTQTRLLMDARGESRDETQRLLSDLELVLVQILGASQAGSMDDDRAREELDLAVRGLEQGEILTRIRSAAPTTMAGA